MPVLAQLPVHLGLGATATILPEFTADMAWYDAYSASTIADGNEGRLVSAFTFDANWDSWEMHPAGAEIVICTKGEITIHQERKDGQVNQVMIREGEYVINPPGVWHTADVAETCTAIFITAGIGTQHRPR